MKKRLNINTKLRQNKFYYRDSPIRISIEVQFRSPTNSLDNSQSEMSQDHDHVLTLWFTLKDERSLMWEEIEAVR